MTEDTSLGGGGEDQPPRAHPQDPAEGADDEQREAPPDIQAHPQDPAEGADDSSATS